MNRERRRAVVEVLGVVLALVGAGWCNGAFILLAATDAEVPALDWYAVVSIAMVVVGSLMYLIARPPRR